MHVEEITSVPSSIMHASEVKKRRKKSINGQIVQTNAAVGGSGGSKSGRKSQNTHQGPGLKP